MGNPPSFHDARSRAGWVVAAAGVVLAWRLVAFRWPSSIISIPEGLHLPLALLGSLFLVCGVAAWWWRPNRWTSVFLVYGLCGGIHWGGSIGAYDSTIDMVFFFVYLSATAMGDAALLHLALIYPKERDLAPGIKIGLYSPAVLAMALAVVAAIAPKELLESAAGIVLLVANLFSLVAGILFLARLFTVEPAIRRAARIPLIASGMLIGSVVALLGAGGALPGEPEAWNLVLGVVPVTLGVALVSHRVS